MLTNIIVHPRTRFYDAYLIAMAVGCILKSVNGRLVFKRIR